MEKVIPIKIPVVADYVLSPDILYSSKPLEDAIYFTTEDDQYGRITFDNLDAIKVCRGEYIPYDFDYSRSTADEWVYQIENSKWQQERFEYENKHYGDSYEFGGDIKEMLTDFKHYLFVFHDQFVEVVTRGFWFEKSAENLFKKELTSGHPRLPLTDEDMELMTVQSLNCQIRKNPKSEAELVHDATFYRQKLFEFTLIFDGDEYSHPSWVVHVIHRNERVLSVLNASLGREITEFEGIVTLETVKPFIENQMKEIAERRTESK